MNEHITKKSFEELAVLAKPLQDWLMDNFNPHCKIEIDCQGVEVLSGEIHIPITAKGS
jgi:hypothetical protein